MVCHAPTEANCYGVAETTMTFILAMLKKVPVSQVRLGMFLHSMEGKWLDNPFWKTRFLLKSERELELLRGSAIREVWIDPSQGLDVEVSAEAVPPSPTVMASNGALPAVEAAPADVLPLNRPAAPMESEIGKAASIAQRGKQQIVGLYAGLKEDGLIPMEGVRGLAAEVSDSVMRQPGALVSLSRLKAQDDYLYLHSLAVSALMVALARQMGMPEEQCRLASLAGLLHNVGMAVVPPELIRKKGPLTDEETFVVRSHPVQGYEMLKREGDVPKEVLEACLHHHERIDGAGYPLGLEGDQIPLFARMCAICDAYDAITSNRSYQSGWDPAESISQMNAWTGQLDPELLGVFVRSLGVYPTGSLVRLQSQRLAIVVDQNAGALTMPVVKVFYSIRSKMHVPPERVDLAHPTCRDRILSREPAAEWAKLGLDSLWAGASAPRRR